MNQTDRGGEARPKASAERIAAEMVRLAALRGPGKTICPSEVARAIAGDHPDAWSPLMASVRLVAVRLMKAGEVVIRRKGKAVDPDDFRGIYRIGLAAPGDDQDGNSASVRPESQ